MAAIRLTKTAWIAFALLNALLLSVIVLLLQIRSERQELAELSALGAAVYPAPRPLTGFELTDQRGQAFRLESLRGAWSLVFFGFSNCPDMCPLTLAELERFYRARPTTEQLPLQVVFVSVDPADTPEVLDEYLQSYHPEFIGLGGSSEAVGEFARQLFVFTGAEDGASDHGGHDRPAGSPEGFISHSIHVGVVSPAGELVGLLRPPHRAAAIAQALELIFQRA